MLPVPKVSRVHSIIQLYGGLVLYGFSTSLLVLAGLGLDPWNVFHQGLGLRVGVSIGTATIVTSAAVMLFWIPLRQKPGLGTLSNGLVIGLVVNLALHLLPTPEPLALRIAALTGAIVCNGIATGLYIGARMGPGPRDGLMTGLAAQGRSIRLVRTAMEVTVLALGWILGGTMGVGTLAYALAIGPIAHITIPFFTIGRRGSSRAGSSVLRTWQPGSDPPDESLSGW